MKKFLALVLIICMVFTLSVTSYAAEDNLLKQYAQEYICLLEGRNDISLTNGKVLKSATTNTPIAMCYSINESGYVIVDVNDYNVLEYCLDGFNPYNNAEGELYYAGLFEYYCGSGNQLKYTLDETVKSDLSEVAAQTADFAAAIQQSDSSLQQKTAEVASARVQRASPISHSLSGTLSTGNLSGYCGPTSAFNMLTYKGMLHSGISGGSAGHIRRIADYTGMEVTLSSMKNGMNNYIADGSVKSPKVTSSTYSFNRVITEIKRNSPISLGTNGGGLATGGHVQTIHKVTMLDTTGTVRYTLYVNNGWGQNNVAIPYDNTPPSYLKDHVYFL